MATFASCRSWTDADIAALTPSDIAQLNYDEMGIFLFMEGGPSHIDTFDPKPKLREMHLKEFTRGGEDKSAMESGKRYFVESPFKFRKAGKCGADMAENWEHLAGVADELCFYRGCQAESVNHPTALYHMNTGNRFGGDPAIGSWVTYGLGSRTRTCQGSSCCPSGLSPGRRGQLEQRLSAGSLPGNAAPPAGESHPQPAAPRGNHPRASAGEPRPAGEAQRGPPGAISVE
jgi:hypothetical protein